MSELGWTIKHPISEKEIISLLRGGIKPPLAVLLLGGNDRNKDIIANALFQKIGGMLQLISNREGISAITPESFQHYQTMYVSLIQGTSASHELRHLTVQQLRQSGVNTIAAIWVKGDPKRNDADSQVTDDALLRNPPNVDGIEYLFEVEP